MLWGRLNVSQLTMSELAFQDHRNRRLRSTYGGATAGDASPDSAIFNLFSSLASGSISIERCSSASDVLDHESRVSDMLPMIVDSELI
ncbi:hypothetical protein Hanom_Chr04g00371301 [Helianthus anomalus]